MISMPARLSATMASTSVVPGAPSLPASAQEPGANMVASRSVNTYFTWLSFSRSSPAGSLGKTG